MSINKEEEIREEVLNYIRSQIECWNKAEGRTTKEKLTGLARSILKMLDGETDLPAFIVAPQEYQHYANVDYDIAGDLHNLI